MAYKYETNAKLLDELMGTGRNQDRVVEVIEVITMRPHRQLSVKFRTRLFALQDFEDPRVCKFFLVGLCPYTLFKNTNDDFGQCPSEVCDDKQALKLRKK